ncbi:MAG: GspE/PulE family protein [bacterium]
MDTFLSYLRDQQIVSSELLDHVLLRSRESNRDFFAELLQSSFANEDVILKSLAEFLAIKFDYIDHATVDPKVFSELSLELIQRYRILPLFKLGHVLFVAVTNPFQSGIFEELSHSLELELDVVLTNNHCFDKSLSLLLDGFEKTKVHHVDVFDSPEETLASDESAVEIVDRIFNQAILVGASDIHFEPFQDVLNVRFRMDGLLKDMMTLPLSLHHSLMSRIKIMANLDITEIRKPQDGRLMVSFQGRQVDFRVSTLMTITGEKMVLRVLDRATAYNSLASLGFQMDVLELLDPLINSSSGVIIVCGPTGSGKTSTLYSMLNQLNSSSRNIVTIEDPVEYKFQGLNQVAVNPELNMTFVSGLKTVLRQDPDVILVGEIRDFDTASVTLQAAMTGHLVFSTLHTRSAAASITRFLDMGHKPFLLNSALLAVIGQRLLRCLCPKCKIKQATYDPLSTKEKRIMEMLLLEDSSVEFCVPVGCSQCFNTGYRGRTGVFEVMVLNEHIRDQVQKKSSSEHIHQVAVDFGMKSILTDAFLKIKQGITSLSEVARVLDF